MILGYSKDFPWKKKKKRPKFARLGRIFKKKSSDFYDKFQ